MFLLTSYLKISPMKKIEILLFVVCCIMPSCILFGQSYSFPSNINISKKSAFIENEGKIDSFPIYFDNTHTLYSEKSSGYFDIEGYGFDLRKKVPLVSSPDQRYNKKFENRWGKNGIGDLSGVYWLPSNGDYIMLYAILENETDNSRLFLITFTLDGKCIDYKLVKDGVNEINFTQAELDSTFTLKLTEIRFGDSVYKNIYDYSTIKGKKVNSVYKITPKGKFVLQSEKIGDEKTYKLDDLTKLLKTLP